jgi:hypothetical protein
MTFMTEIVSVFVGCTIAIKLVQRNALISVWNCDLVSVGDDDVVYFALD